MNLWQYDIGYAGCTCRKVRLYILNMCQYIYINIYIYIYIYILYIYNIENTHTVSVKYIYLYTYIELSNIRMPGNGVVTFVNMCDGVGWFGVKYYLFYM